MMIYTDYVSQYEHKYQTTIPHRQFILNLVRQWQIENIPPDSWREWVKENKSLFKRLNVKKESLVFLNDFLYFVEETYEKECEEESSQDKRSNWIKTVIQYMKKWITGLKVELNQIIRRK